MKKILLFSCMAIAIASCNDAAKKEVATTTDSTTITPATAKAIEFPYALSKPYNDWQPGDQQHAAMVMKSLKSFTQGDIAAAMADFSDSVELRFDYYHVKLAKDSLVKVMTRMRSEYQSIDVEMNDWESVISKDKKEQWVTLWYKQKMVDKKGKADSLSIVDDAKIENGKITILDEKIQHFPVKK